MPEKDKYFDLEKMVDDAFTSSPEFSLPDNFAEVVAEKVGRTFAWELYLKEFLIYLGVFVGVGLVAAGITLMTFEYNWTELFAFLFANLGLIIGIYFISTFVLFADRVILRYFMYKSKIEVV